jgi:hypothetical protein
MLCGLTRLEINRINQLYRECVHSSDNGAHTSEWTDMAEKFCIEAERAIDVPWFHHKLIELRKTRDPEDPSRYLLAAKKPQRLPKLPTLSERQKAILCKLYDTQPITLDDLPYTTEIELLATEFRKKGKVSWSTNVIFRHLSNIRRSSGLPRKVRIVKPMPLLDSKPSPKLRRPSNPEANPE